MQMIRKPIIWLIAIVGACILFLIIDFSVKSRMESGKVNANMVKLESKPIRTTSGWGYNIMVGNKIYIHQQCIPAVPGNKPFLSKEDALKTAEVVIKKMVNHRLPYVTRRELDSLHVSM
jgi:hypothetical protein